MGEHSILKREWRHLQIIMVIFTNSQWLDRNYKTIQEYNTLLQSPWTTMYEVLDPTQCLYVERCSPVRWLSCEPGKMIRTE